MSPAPLVSPREAPAVPVISPSSVTKGSIQVYQKPQERFDDLFGRTFRQLLDEYARKPDRDPGGITDQDRKEFLQRAYYFADEQYFGGRQLVDPEHKLRALTKLFVRAIAEDPWSEDWIRPHDVERKLSRFELHKDSVELARQYGYLTPREAIRAARQAQETAEEADPKTRVPLGPFDDIEVIFIPGTVSSSATNKIDRDSIYPVSVSSVANAIYKHPCRGLTTPFRLAEKFVTLTDTEELIRMRRWACDVCDFAPHLLDNDNISLLVVLLILPRSEVVGRFANNGIRIEGSTISHRRAECTKSKLGWRNTEERKPYDNTATDFQTRIKNAISPPYRGSTAARVSRPRGPRKSSSNSTPAFNAMPPIGYYPPPLSTRPPGMRSPSGAPSVSPASALSPSPVTPTSLSLLHDREAHPLKSTNQTFTHATPTDNHAQAVQTDTTNATLRQILGGKEKIVLAAKEKSGIQNSAQRKRKAPYPFQGLSGVGSKEDPMDLS